MYKQCISKLGKSGKKYAKLKKKITIKNSGSLKVFGVSL